MTEDPYNDPQNPHSRWKLPALMAEAYEWWKWWDKMPALQFPEEWRVKILPPVLGAIVRFHVEDPTGQHVEVYLDCYEMISIYGGPHWAVVPNTWDLRIQLFPMNDAAGLIEGIRGAFKAMQVLEGRIGK